MRKPSPKPWSRAHALKRGRRTAACRAPPRARGRHGRGRDGRAEDRQDPVAQEPDERAARVQDGVRHLAEVAVEHVDHAIGRGALGKRREAAQVAEHDRRVEPDAAQARIAPAAQQHLLDDAFGQEARKGVAQPVALEHVQAPARQAGVDARPQQNGIERLREVILGARFDAADHTVVVVDRGDHDHGDVSQRGIVLHLTEHLEPVHARHDDVEQHEVDVTGAQRGQRLDSVLRGRDAMALALQAAPQDGPVQRVVVNHEDLARSVAHEDRSSRAAASPGAARAASASTRATSSPASAGSAARSACSSSRHAFARRLRSERGRIRLQRVRDAMQPLRIALRGSRRAAPPVARAIRQEVVDQLRHELAITDGFLEPRERGVDGEGRLCVGFVPRRLQLRLLPPAELDATVARRLGARKSARSLVSAAPTAHQRSSSAPRPGHSSRLSRRERKNACTPCAGMAGNDRPRSGPGRAARLGTGPAPRARTGGGDPSTDKLAQILARGTLILSTDPAYPPQSYRVKGAKRLARTKCAANQMTANQMGGYDADTGKLVAQRLGVEPCFVTPTWSEIISGHWNDRWDISYGSGAINSDRASRLYFTQPYYAAPQLFFVAKKSKFQKPSDLDGKNIGVCAGCTHELYLKRTLTIPGVKVVFKVKNPKIAIFDVENPGLKKVAEGKIDAFLCAAPEGDGAIHSGPEAAGDQGARVLHVPDRVRGSLLVARRQGVRRKVNSVVAGLHADGSLQEALDQGLLRRRLRDEGRAVRPGDDRADGQVVGSAATSRRRLRLPRRGLMVRLVGSFLILSVLMVAAVSVLAYVRARSSLQSSIYDRLDAAVDQKSGAISSWIDDERRNVVFVGQLLGGTESAGDPQLKRLSRELLVALDEHRGDAPRGARRDPRGR